MHFRSTRALACSVDLLVDSVAYSILALETMHLVRTCHPVTMVRRKFEMRHNHVGYPRDLRVFCPSGTPYRVHGYLGT